MNILNILESSSALAAIAAILILSSQLKRYLKAL